MKITTDRFGKLPDGGEVLLYTIENDHGMRVEISSFGGVVRSLYVPDREGQQADVVLGYASLEDYIKNPGYFGALVGRNSNRIKGSVLEMPDGMSYQLDRNDGDNNLHGGFSGLSFRLFEAEIRTFQNMTALLLRHKMEHNSDGFPGTLTVTVTYALTSDNTLMIDYRAISDADTIINLTNHSYFNLGGHDSGSIFDHELWLDASFYTPNTPACIPSGEIHSVEGTPFDFRTPKPIGQEINSTHEQIALFGGYDHNFALNGSGYRKIAAVNHAASGRVMHAYTDLPGVQLYTSNKLVRNGCKNGANYGPHQAFCLETQTFPNALQMPWLVSPLYKKGEEYASTTAYQFLVD